MGHFVVGACGCRVEFGRRVCMLHRNCHVVSPSHGILEGNNNLTQPIGARVLPVVEGCKLIPPGRNQTSDNI